MIDLSKLTPAPWVCEDRRNAALKNIRVLAGAHDLCWMSDVHQRDYLGSFTGDHKAADEIDSIGLANAEFIALARNAFDVMMRRGWYPWLNPQGVWLVNIARRTLDNEEDECVNEMFDGDLSCQRDPFTALVEADKWYAENVEKRERQPV